MGHKKGRGTLHEMVEQARKGIKSTWGDFAAEGIVARPAVELKTRAGHRIITKIKSKDFALTQKTTPPTAQPPTAAPPQSPNP